MNFKPWCSLWHLRITFDAIYVRHQMSSYKSSKQYINLEKSFQYPFSFNSQIVSILQIFSDCQKIGNIATLVLNLVDVTMLFKKVA